MDQAVPVAVVAELVPQEQMSLQLHFQMAVQVVQDLNLV
jgi:hypothetical protein